MRVEWAKARVHMNRWKEEVLLVQEEMRRVLAYHEWRAMWWQQQSSLRKVGNATIQVGITGYANKQAAISRRMGELCTVYWLPRLKDKGIIPSWASKYEASIQSCPVDDEEEGEGYDEDLEETLELGEGDIEINAGFDLDN